ncbi:hypothetical protein JCM1841_002765 [Sporobolomyces salmonicolor]
MANASANLGARPASPRLVPVPSELTTPSGTPASTAPSTLHTPASFPLPSYDAYTPDTAYTTPGTSPLGKTDGGWGSAEEDALAMEAARAPRGFKYLEKGFREELGLKRGVARSFDWEVDTRQETGQSLRRRLGPTEVSYYLGSRGDGVEGGVNDMYLHLGFKARSSLMNGERVLDIWTEIIRRHALLSSSVTFTDYYNVHFCYDAPKSISEVREKASSLLEIKTSQNSKDYLDAYLNGPRTLSDQRLAYLVLSTPEPTFSSASDEMQQYDFFLLSTHFLGDGMALHTTANEFFSLLAEKEERESLSTTSSGELAFELGKFPPAMETKVVTPEKWGKMAWAGAQVEFENDQGKLIGGQSFPRAKRGNRHTLVPTVCYDSAKTKRILATCKAHGSTIANAIFALSNLAYIRSMPKEQLDVTLPSMIYSALNVRPFLKKEDQRDYYHIAIGYYNVILPSFLPKSIPLSTYFWHQAASVKHQTSRAVKSPFLPSRTQLMALERERRSIGFEKADEAKRLQQQQAKQGTTGIEGALQGLGISAAEKQESEEGRKVREAESMKVEGEKAKAAGTTKVQATGRPEKVPSAALMGLSMLGNLDAMYKHVDYHGIELHTLTTGSRQRPGALLLFAYTFAGKLWLSLGYDSHGFQEGVIEGWWDELLNGVDELLDASA